MINNLLLILSLSGVALGSIACCILLFSNNRHKYANRLLALTLFGLVNILLATFLFVWNPDFYAYIYRFPSPLLFSIFPAAYLYTRADIHNEKKLVQRDLLHFLPSVLYLIEMLPHYFTSYQYRLNIVREIKNHPSEFITLNEGLIPPYWHIGFLSVQAICYLIITFILFQNVKRLKDRRPEVDRTKLYHWMKLFLYLTSIIAVPMSFTLISTYSFLYENLQPLLLTFTCSFVIIKLYLFFQPEILYGISRNNVPFLSPSLNLNDHLPENTKQRIEFKQTANRFRESTDESSELSNLENYKPVLESYIKSNTPFLKQGYSIYDLSRDTGIPQHHLSALLNRVYQMRFTDYINGLRICYIKQHFGNQEWEKLTLEGIAKHAGFSSRTTFFNAIKKTAGIPPSAFLAGLKKQQSNLN
jgi:AraC-like DNA-binding protein